MKHNYSSRTKNGFYNLSFNVISIQLKCIMLKSSVTKRMAYIVTGCALLMAFLYSVIFRFILLCKTETLTH